MTHRPALLRAVSALSLVAFVSACGGVQEDATMAEAEDAAVEEVSSDAVDAEASAQEAAAERAAKAAENAAASASFLEANGGKDGVVSTESGLQYLVLEEGGDGGASPLPTDTVDVHYVGTLIDGTEFDSSRARGAAARFQANQVIEGWIEGLQLMSEGDRFRFFIPPALAYGDNGTPGGPIGPNEALIFDVELLRVNNPERNLETAATFLAENGGKEGVKTTDSGLQYKILTEGDASAASPNETNVVKVHYEGRLLNGTVFDSSYERGEPAEFPLGRVIPGWIEGVQLMKEGDKYQFFIKPDLAYGERGTPGGPIGPNELLVFDVELLEVKE
ncbi:MAG: FKBP-type peptidyl-prolyl cis-trans isomerase [Pseudomonadota bacterium]